MWLFAVAAYMYLSSGLKNVTLSSENVGNLSVRDNSQDVVFFTQSLHHLDDPKSPMNKAVATPIDFVNYAKKHHKNLKHNFLNYLLLPKKEKKLFYKHLFKNI